MKEINSIVVRSPVEIEAMRARARRKIFMEEYDRQRAILDAIDDGCLVPINEVVVC